MDVDGKHQNRRIENHKKAVAHYIEAAKYNLEAAKHYEEGNYDRAAHSKMLA